jgi:hypothetical protein
MWRGVTFVQRVGDELRPVVHADGQRRTAHLDQLGQRADDPCCRQAGVDLDAQGLAVELVDDVEGPEASPAPQGVGHEVAAPALVGLAGAVQRQLHACWQALSYSSPKPCGGFNAMCWLTKSTTPASSRRTAR